MNSFIFEDRVCGRRLVLKNGVLVVERVKPLSPEQIALLVDAMAGWIERLPEGEALQRQRSYIATK